MHQTCMQQCGGTQSFPVETGFELQGTSFDFLRDFDEVADVMSPGCLRGFEPTVHPNSAAACQESRSSPSEQSASPAPVDLPLTSAISKPQGGQRNAEANRAHQKKFRQRQRERFQRMQCDLAHKSATIEQLRAENRRLSMQAQQPATQGSQQQLVLNPFTLPSTAKPARQVFPKLSLANSIFCCTWAVGDQDTLKCTVHHADEVMSIYQIRRMAPQQMMVLWQEYIRELAICLATGGASVKEDPHSDAAKRLSQLQTEQKMVFVTTAAADFKKYNRFMKQGTLASGDKGPSLAHEFEIQRARWTQLAHKLQFTEEQKGSLFLLRRAHLQHQAFLLRQRQELQLEAGAVAHSGPCSSSGAAAAELQQQIEELDMQMEEEYFAYKGIMVDGVFTLWQLAMAGVSLFPHSSCVMTFLVDILADEAGEPNAADVQAAVKHFTLADEGCYDLASIQSYIYGSRAYAAYAANKPR